MTRRYDQIRRGLISAIEHALSEGATWARGRAEDGPARRIFAIQLGSRCVECAQVVVERSAVVDGPPSARSSGPQFRHATPLNYGLTHLDRDHEALPDDEASGVVFHVDDGTGSLRQLAFDDEIWAAFGLDGLCDVLDVLVKPTELAELGRYLAFGKELL